MTASIQLSIIWFILYLGNLEFSKCFESTNDSNWKNDGVCPLYLKVLLLLFCFGLFVCFELLKSLSRVLF